MSRVVVSLVPKLCLSLSGNSVHQTQSCGTVGLSPPSPSPSRGEGSMSASDRALVLNEPDTSFFLPSPPEGEGSGVRGHFRRDFNLASSDLSEQFPDPLKLL